MSPPPPLRRACPGIEPGSHLSNTGRCKGRFDAKRGLAASMSPRRSQQPRRGQILPHRMHGRRADPFSGPGTSFFGLRVTGTSIFLAPGLATPHGPLRHGTVIGRDGRNEKNPSPGTRSFSVFRKTPVRRRLSGFGLLGAPASHRWGGEEPALDPPGTTHVLPCRDSAPLDARLAVGRPARPSATKVFLMA